LNPLEITNSFGDGPYMINKFPMIYNNVSKLFVAQMMEQRVILNFIIDDFTKNVFLEEI